MTDKEFISICESALTMSEAASKVGLHFNTFKRKAVKLGCYKPNPGRAGGKKPWVEKRSIPLQEILDGSHPQYQTYKLKHKLFKYGLKKNKCEECGITEWNGKPIQCELDHIDGDRTNHNLNNLKILCPNCHSQTNTFRSKNRK